MQDKQARGWSLWPALLYPSLQNFESPPIQKKRSVSRQSRLRRAMLGISARAICNHSDEQIESTATRREQHKSRLHLWCEICSPLLSGRKACSIEAHPDMELVYPFHIPACRRKCDVWEQSMKTSKMPPRRAAGPKPCPELRSCSAYEVHSWQMAYHGKEVRYPEATWASSLLRNVEG